MRQQPHSFQAKSGRSAGTPLDRYWARSRAERNSRSAMRPMSTSPRHRPAQPRLPDHQALDTVPRAERLYTTAGGFNFRQFGHGFLQNTEDRYYEVGGRNAEFGKWEERFPIYFSDRINRNRMSFYLSDPILKILLSCPDYLWGLVSVCISGGRRPILSF